MGNGMRRLVDRASVGLFLAALWLPLLAGLVGLDPATGRQEKRRLAPPPTVDGGLQGLVAFPARFDAFYKDHFGLRATLIRWHNLAMLRWLHASPSSEVIVGEQGWLFLATPDMRDDLQGARSFAVGGLEVWRQALEARQRWLAARGARYLVVIAPEKQSIYPEYLGIQVPRQSPDSRLEQFLAHMRARSTAPVLDLRPALRAAKAQGRLYHRTDTHWNGYGAWVAYAAIVEGLSAWFPRARPQPLSAFEPVHRQSRGGDLTMLMGLRDLFREDVVQLRPRRPLVARPQLWAPLADPALASAQVQAFARPGAPVGRAVFLHDSFGDALVPFLAEDFARFVAVGRQFDAPGLFPYRLIQRAGPRVVIQEIAERALLQRPPRLAAP